jgi:thioredoxin-dependent peroxiredoxin
MIEDKYFAPEFELINQDLEKVGLNQLCNDSWLVLYFYPKDNTSGCSQQAQDFKQYYERFQKKNCNVVGVSKDSVKSHLNFIEKYDLPFPLLVDNSAEVATLFGVYVEKSMYGRKYMGTERSTFLISPEREIIQAWRKVKVTNHVRMVYESLSNLNL